MDEVGDRTKTREHRRGSRFHVVVPVEVAWEKSDGTPMKETAEAKEANAFGGLLEMKTYPRVGIHLQLTNLVSHDSTVARVAAIRYSQDGAPLGAAVEFLNPSEVFWGINFQLCLTSSQLARIEQAIKAGGVDGRILRDFRDAVDYVRKTAWAVQEWQERQLKQRDPHTVLPLITAERIRRTTQLSKAIMVDLATHEVTRQTPGIEDLFRAVETLHERVGGLFGEH